MIELVFPQRRTLDRDELEHRLAAVRAEPPEAMFAAEVEAFLGRFSAAIFASPKARAYPQIVSLGYWLRPAVLAQVKAGHADLLQPGPVVRSPRGLVFHLPPANVDVLFVYSWAVSLLCGNANVVRLPSQGGEVADILIELLQDCAGERIARRNLFVRYPADDSLTALVSRVCDVRMVWGGDEKVRAIRRIELPVNAIELDFANRFSICALKAEAVAALDDAGLRKLSADLYNDVFWFDQMGCSSPRAIYWVGERDEAQAQKARLHAALESAVQDKGYALEPGLQISRYAYGLSSAIVSDAANLKTHGGAFVSFDTADVAHLRRGFHGGGVLASSHLDDLSDLEAVVRREDQTLSYFGFSRDELVALARKLGGRGIDRMAPVGQALNFGVMWDGFNLLESLTRGVHVV